MRTEDEGEVHRAPQSHQSELLEEAFFELPQNATKVTRAEPPPSAEEEARLADAKRTLRDLASHLHRLRSDGPEAQDGKAKKQTADQRDKEELRPDHTDACAAIEDRLGKRHKMG
jgi:hypothetical protein